MPPSDDRRRECPDSAWARPMPCVLAAVLVGVVVAMGAVASARGWLPTGDDAFLSLRSRHTIGSHPILLNNASSAGPSAGTQYNHPGAMPLTLMWPFTRTLGPGGIALATAVLNAALLAGLVVVVRRIAGATGALATVSAGAAMVWSMGPALLVDPWNPNLTILSTGLAVVAAWGVVERHHRHFAVVVCAASIALQSHLSAVVPAVATVTVAGIGWSLHLRRERSTSGRRALWGSLGFAVAVGLVVNVQVLADQFFGTGNLTKVLRGSHVGEATVSVRQAAAVLVDRFVIPPMWFRGSWQRPVLADTMPSGSAIVAGAMALALLSVLVVWRGSPAVRRCLGVTAVVALCGAVMSLRFPLRVGIPIPYFRFLWPLAAIWWVLVLATAAQVLSEITDRRSSRLAHEAVEGVPGGAPDRAPWRALPAAVALMLLVLAWMPAPGEESPNPRWARVFSAPLAAAAVANTRPGEEVLVEQSIQEVALWAIPAVIDQLDAAGRRPRAADRVLVQQTSPGYRATGAEKARLVFRGGLQIDDAPTGGRMIARHDALAPADRARLDRFLTRYGPMLARRGGVRLTAVGEAETDVDALRFLTTGRLPPRELVRSVVLRLAVERGALSIEGVPREAVGEALRLGALDGGRSIALYLVRD
ncbi:MAG: hypothetical protein R2698_11820 [Microthrixaceae bacterium]